MRRSNTTGRFGSASVLGHAPSGSGSLKVCRDSLWITLHVAADQLAAEFGNADPATWLKTASRTGFQPGLIPNTMRTTNRPTFQQVLEFQHPWWRGF